MHQTVEAHRMVAKRIGSFRKYTNVNGRGVSAARENCDGNKRDVTYQAHTFSLGGGQIFSQDRPTLFGPSVDRSWHPDREGQALKAYVPSCYASPRTHMAETLSLSHTHTNTRTHSPFRAFLRHHHLSPPAPLLPSRPYAACRPPSPCRRSAGARQAGTPSGTGRRPATWPGTRYSAASRSSKPAARPDRKQDGRTGAGSGLPHSH